MDNGAIVVLDMGSSTNVGGLDGDQTGQCVCRTQRCPG